MPNVESVLSRGDPTRHRLDGKRDPNTSYRQSTLRKHRAPSNTTAEYLDTLLRAGSSPSTKVEVVEQIVPSR